MMHIPCWFKFGDSCNIDVNKQVRISKELIGNDAVGDAQDDIAVLQLYITKRRKGPYTKFYRGEKADIPCYYTFGMPRITHNSLDIR